jgi:hypothetical protein
MFVLFTSEEMDRVREQQSKLQKQSSAKKKLNGIEEHVLIAACAHQERSRKVENFISC